MNVKEQISAIEALQAEVEQLKSTVAQLSQKLESKAAQKSTREMTDDDARNILNGELRTTPHGKCAEKLGLSYGQVYSCRLQFTFKHIHKELEKVEGYKNLWVK